MDKKQIIMQKYAIRHEITEEEYNEAKETNPNEFELYYVTCMEKTRDNDYSDYAEVKKYYHLEFISDEETKLQILFDILQKEKGINRNTDTIKSIAICFLVISIFGILFSILNTFHIL